MAMLNNQMIGRVEMLICSRNHVFIVLAYLRPIVIPRVLSLPVRQRNFSSMSVQCTASI